MKKTTTTTTKTTKTTTSNYSCKFCDKQFKTKSKFNRHVKEIHLNPAKTFNCDFCPKKFKRREHYKRHMKGKHLEEKFQCPYCPSKHVEKSRLKTHFVKNHDFVQCFSCGAFHAEGDKKSHTCSQEMLFMPLHLIKHGVVFDCDRCLTCFVSKDELKCHSCATNQGSLNQKAQDELSVTTHEDTQGSEAGCSSSPKKYQSLLEAPTQESTPINFERLFSGKHSAAQNQSPEEDSDSLLTKRAMTKMSSKLTDPAKRLKFAEKRRSSFELKPISLQGGFFQDCTPGPSPVEEIKFRKFFLEDDVIETNDLASIFECSDNIFEQEQ